MEKVIAHVDFQKARAQKRHDETVARVAEQVFIKIATEQKKDFELIAIAAFQCAEAFAKQMEMHLNGSANQ